MKKIIIIAALIGCMMPVMAQKNNDKTPLQQMKESKQNVEQLNCMAGTYTQKLDSVIYSFGAKTVLTYDQNLNCTNSSEYELDYTGSGWELDLSTDYEYDNQNRIVTITYLMSDYRSKETWEYDSNGRISVQYMWTDMDGEWYAYHKMVYDYDSQDNVIANHLYGIEDDMVTWFEMQREVFTYNDNGQPTESMFYMWDYTLSDLVLDSKTVWTYNAQQQCIKTEGSYMDSGSWILNDRTEYAYDSNGNLISEIESRSSFDSEGLVYDWKTEYQYDNHSNVIQAVDYSYEDQDWVFSERMELEYDQTVSASKVAGYYVLFGSGDYSEMFHDKILKVTSIDDDDNANVMTFHYSAANEVNEIAQSPCVVWPNPATEVLNINGDNLLQVEIYSIDGRLVMTLGEGTESINVKGLERGHYLLKATLKDGSVSTHKFVKSK